MTTSFSVRTRRFWVVAGAMLLLLVGVLLFAFRRSDCFNMGQLRSEQDTQGTHTLNSFYTSLLSAIVSSTVAGIVVGVVVLRRAETIKREVEVKFQTLQATFQTQRSWQQSSVAELLGPLVIQFDRTRRAFDRWRNKNLFLEAKVIRKGNLAIRDLLLKSPHLIPPELLEHAGVLIEHYDRWLEEYERIRLDTEPELQTPFVFVGPAGYPFPHEAEKAFKLKYHLLWRSLYGSAANPLVINEPTV